MSRRLVGRFAVTTIFVALAALIGIGSANGADGASRVGGFAGVGSATEAPDGSPLTHVEEYRAAFAAAYQPAVYDRMALSDAEAAVQRADYSMSPVIALEQELHWIGYRDLAAELTTTLRVPLYDSRYSIDSALAALDLQIAALGAATSRAAATLTFFVDLATYSTLAEASTRLTRALERYGTVPWLSEPHADPATVEPGERALYEAHVRLVDMSAFLDEQRDEVRLRLARSLGVSGSLIAPPQFSDVRSAVPLPPTQPECLDRAPESTAAQQRSARAAVAALLPDVPVFRLELSGGAGLSLGSPDSYSAIVSTPAAAIALQASLALPSGGPFGPTVETTADARASLSGATQSLRVAWPRTPQLTQIDEDPDLVLADELDRIATNLRAMRRAVAQARSERDRLERALTWLALDDGVPAGTLALAAWPNVATAPMIAVQAADLSTQLAFAELEEFVAAAQLTVACGAWP